MPSDHLVTGRQAFRGAMAAAVAQARQGRLVTLGIPPTEPATRFGYLELADPPAALNPQRVRRFVEKPPPAKARHYAASGRHLWNSGIFIWRAARLLEEAARHLPETYRALAPLAAHFGRATFARKARRAFDRLTAVSIDYGIMERAEEVWVVPAAFPWSDLGGWRAAEALLRPDKSGNRCAGRVELDEVSGTLAVTSEDEAMLVAGVRDLVVVRGPGGVLVCHKSAADRLKPLVGRILGGP
jgi:mannose-1-phosphate guanylyltransferase